MKIDIFDVGHGGCALVTAPNGARVLVDCGFNGERSWFPSVALHGEFIDLLVVTNLDEDHVDDLPYVWETIRFGALFTNPTVSAAALAAMKPLGMRAGVSKMHALLPYLTDGKFGSIPVNLGGASAWCYYNRYPYFRETNDLSLAVFFSYAGFTILFAGDLEKRSWRNLLQMPEFVADLRCVSVLVASHHGRESGCCAEIFEVVRPHIVVMSDGEKRHESQETRDWYRARTIGIPDFSLPVRPTGERPLRSVLTTLSDGTINIEVEESGFFLVETEVTLGRRSLTPIPSISPFGILPQTPASKQFGIAPSAGLAAFSDLASRRS